MSARDHRNTRDLLPYFYFIPPVREKKHETAHRPFRTPYAGTHSTGLYIPPTHDRTDSRATFSVYCYLGVASRAHLSTDQPLLLPSFYMAGWDFDIYPFDSDATDTRHVWILFLFFSPDIPLLTVLYFLFVDFGTLCSSSGYDRIGLASSVVLSLLFWVFGDFWMGFGGVEFWRFWRERKGVVEFEVWGKTMREGGRPGEKGERPKVFRSKGRGGGRRPFFTSLCSELVPT